MPVFSAFTPSKKHLTSFTKAFYKFPIMITIPDLDAKTGSGHRHVFPRGIGLVRTAAEGKDFKEVVNEETSI
jgi:hypothetical protein